MSLELLYTSATAGLRPGTRGFCTVLHTGGTPANLVSRLEGLSGYRHVYAPQSESAGRNPVRYSHLRFAVGGQHVSVVSRVAAYGVDYSGRTNKLAHHVVPEPHELPAAGPAWLLSQQGLMRTEWNGETQTPISGPPIPAGDVEPAICQRWESLAGDAGWGGVVAEAFSNVRAKPLWLIHSLDQHPYMLELINESIAILPRQQRWLATFSTYYTNLPPEIDCRVRCVLNDTDEARAAKAQGNVVDLTERLPESPPTSYTELARTGQVPLVAKETVANSPDPHTSLGSEIFARTGDSVPFDQASSGKDFATALEPGRPTSTGTATPPPVSSHRPRKRRALLLTIFASVAMVITALVAYTFTNLAIFNSYRQALNSINSTPEETHSTKQSRIRFLDKLKNVENEIQRIESNVAEIRIPEPPEPPSIQEIDVPQIPDLVNSVQRAHELIQGNPLSKSISQASLGQLKDRLEKNPHYPEYETTSKGPARQELNAFLDVKHDTHGGIGPRISQLENHENRWNAYIDKVARVKQSTKEAIAKINGFQDDANQIMHAFDAMMADMPLDESGVDGDDQGIGDVEARLRRLNTEIRDTKTSIVGIASFLDTISLSFPQKEQLRKAKEIRDDVTDARDKAEKVGDYAEQLESMSNPNDSEASDQTHVDDKVVDVTLRYIPISKEYRFSGEKEFTAPSTANAKNYTWTPGGGDMSSGRLRLLPSPTQGKSEEPGKESLSVKLSDCRSAPKHPCEITLEVSGDGIKLRVKVDDYAIRDQPPECQLNDRFVADCWEVVQASKSVLRTANDVKEWVAKNPFPSMELEQSSIESLRRFYDELTRLSNKDLNEVDQALSKDLQKVIGDIRGNLDKLESGSEGASGSSGAPSARRFEMLAKKGDALANAVEKFIESHDDFGNGGPLKLGRVAFFAEGGPLDVRKKELGDGFVIEPIFRLNVAPSENK